MKFTETHIPGVYIIDIEPFTDERGFFSRSYCIDEFDEMGLHTHWVQENISFNTQKGTFRGMHLQLSPYQEIKLVRCTQGKIFDIALDLRRQSSTYKQWVGVELTSQNHRMLYIPEGIAHGFQTLTDNTEVFYHMGEFYHPESARGYRWDDPAWEIQLPIPLTMISPKDAAYTNYLQST